MKKSHDTNLDPQSPAIPDSIAELMNSGIDVKLHLIQYHAHLAYLLAQELLEEEVTSLAGVRYERDKPLESRYRRWGSNPGSVRIDEERVPVRVPRVRDVEAGCERPLESYQSLKEGIDIDDQLEQSILLGLSTRDYSSVAGSILDGFGISPSSVSRAFQERSSEALTVFETRQLSEEQFIALWIDGKHLARHQIVICMGLSEDGRKIPLGFVETTTENAEAVAGLLRDLIRRGLAFQEGLLCVIDGSKGLKAAVEEVFGKKAAIQRCQFHKRENVISYLNEKDKESYRMRLQRAYMKKTYKEAREALYEIHADLEKLNHSAANSLLEGLEETLTMHGLGLIDELGRSLKTTNAIENLNGQLEKRIGRVKRWMNSDQRQRWVAMSLLDIEPRMRRIDSFDKLPLLRAALIDYIENKRQKAAENESSNAENFN